jgi:hypothetical protein
MGLPFPAAGGRRLALTLLRGSISYKMGRGVH